MPSPSTKQRKASVVRFVRDMMKRVCIRRVVVEEGQFDTSSLAAGRKLVGMEFQHSEYEGRNWREKVLRRDGYTCQHCGAKEGLQAHHIIPQGRGGTDRVVNGVSLCGRCHEALHRGEWRLGFKPESFKAPTWLMQGKRYLRDRLEGLGLEVEGIYGWMTACWREELGLAKGHVNDAIAMVCRGDQPSIVEITYRIKPRRSKVWRDNPTRRCKERRGFRHYDLILAKHRRLGKVVGSVRSLKAKQMAIRTKESDDFLVSYSKSRLLQRPKGLIYSY